MIHTPLVHGTGRSTAADCASIHTTLADGAGRSMAADCASIHTALGDMISIHTALAVRWLIVDSPVESNALRMTKSRRKPEKPDRPTLGYHTIIVDLTFNVTIAIKAASFPISKLSGGAGCSCLLTAASRWQQLLAGCCYLLTAATR